jgi:hypothetical protein
VQGFAFLETELGYRPSQAPFAFPFISFYHYLFREVKINVKTNATVKYFPINDQPSPQEMVITKLNE